MMMLQRPPKLITCKRMMRGVRLQIVRERAQHGVVHTAVVLAQKCGISV
jgi:hypothetical protein